MASAPQHYCLRWNNYQSNLTSVFDQLLQSESFVDVTLAVDGRSLKAHKVILSACSPYFQTLLHDNPCQHPIVILKDVTYADMHAVVQFMYKGEISVAEQQLSSLLKVAEALKIRGLADVPEGGGLSRASPEAAPSPAADSSSPRGLATPELIESCVDVAALSPASGAASPLVSRSQDSTEIRPAIAEMIKDEERD
ncbi:Protein bric-a-brac 2 [Amphibalanus amphitrite]|uniref:Protein bric-a-brac 2 n=1 Tax=Amphibalanus amphitrite TaxID=1232801 RepID=A0A6A4WIK7_AMPAM|nr:Protein bric-a-brac 2 [Amphibalanus amphitrite]